MSRLATTTCLLVVLLLLPAAAAGAWSEPSLVPGVPAFADPEEINTVDVSAGPSGAAIWLIPPNAGARHWVEAPVIGGSVLPARTLTNSFQVFGLAVYGAGRVVAAGIHGARIEAGFGTLTNGLGRPRLLGLAHRVSAPAVAANDRGQAAVAFADVHGLELAWREPGRGFGRLQHFSGSTRPYAFIWMRMNSRGDLIVAWTGRKRGALDRLYVRIRSRNGRWSPVRNVAPVFHFDGVSVDIASDGSALLGWFSSSDARAAYASPGGHWQAPHLLERTDIQALFEDESPSIVARMSADGTGTLVREGGSGKSRVVRAADVSQGRFTHAQSVSDPAGVAALTGVSIRQRGAALVVWNELTQFGGSGLTKAAVREPGSSSFGQGEAVPGATETAVGWIDAANQEPFVVWTDQFGLRYSRFGSLTA